MTYLGENSLQCENNGKLCINIVKMYNNEVDGSFIAFGRVISGTIRED